MVVVGWVRVVWPLKRCLEVMGLNRDRVLAEFTDAATSADWGCLTSLLRVLVDGLDLGVDLDGCLFETVDVLLTFAASRQLAGLYLKGVLVIVTK